MIKTIWNPGDIITTEKWNKINNNLSILGAYQLPVIQSQNNDSSSIIIDKSYNEITTLLKQGVICYFISEENNDNENYLLSILIITGYNDSTQVLYSTVGPFYVLNANQMYQQQLPVT